jgi:ligand-binding sensor domain-containing protein/signal transduction histidine kinase
VRSGTPRLVVVAIAVLVVMICRCWAQGGSSRDSDYIRTDFTVEDGLPDNTVNGIVQTENGLLWVGTEAGLAAFDGRDFHPVQLRIPGAPPQGVVHDLLEAANGDLWVGSDAGVFLIPKRALDQLAPSPSRFFPMGAGKSDEVEALLQTRNGVLWVGTDHGLYRQDGSTFVDVLPGSYVSRLHEALNGHLLVVTGQGFVEFDGQRTIEHPGLGARYGVHNDQIFDVNQDSSGTIWYSTNAGIRREGLHSFPALRPNHAYMTSSSRTYEDPQGNIWVSTGVGVYRVQGDFLISPDSTVDARCIYVSRDGGVWLGTNGNGLVHFKRRIVRMYTKADGLPNDLAMTVLPSRDGRLWIGNNCGLSMFDGKKFKVYVEKDGLSNSCVWALAEDHHRNLWIGTYGGGLFSFLNGRFTQYTIKQGLPSKIVFQIVVARDDSLWCATPDGLSHMQGGHFHNYTTADGLSSNRILSVHQDRNGTIWVESQAGVDRLIGQRFAPLASSRPSEDELSSRFAEDSSGDLMTTNAPKGISLVANNRVTTINQDLDVMDMVESPNGSLWFSSRHGIIHVAQKDLIRPVGDRDSFLNYGRIDRADGLNSTQSSVGSPNIAITSDHMLWVATVKGLAMVDLAHWPEPSRSPKIILEGVTVEGHNVPADKRLVLPPGTHHVELHLAAVDLASPERIRLQYRMDGVDPGWLDGGASRTAVYTNIPVGAHTFFVRATDNNGKWDRNGIAYSIVQRPFFYQTTWFQAACAGVLILILTAAYLSRVHHIVRQTRILLEERIVERERIARDLHDTFLQGVQGLFLRFHTGTQQLPKDQPARQIFEDALQQSDRVMLEGRGLVSDLRASKTDTDDLPTAFALVGKESRPLSSAGFDVIVSGRTRDLNTIVYDEVYKIGREAIFNAFRHANAKDIEVEVDSGPSELRIRIRDDGVGIDSSVLKKGNRVGHYGLPGMRERATKIGGHLDLWSRSGMGTELELRVPAAIAYLPSASRMKVRWLNRFLGGRTL